MNLERARVCGYDNLRVLLITCVVFGHLLELIGGKSAAPLQRSLYFLIYSFHIPALIFLNGYFARFSWRRVLRFFALYLIFQTAYLMFNRHVLNNSLEIQYEKPYWLLWYLMSLGSYYLLIPLLSRIPVRFAGVPVCISILVSLAAGLEKSIGYEYSLSRTLVFLPFFAVGHFAGRRKNQLRSFFINKQSLWIPLGAAALGMTAMLYAGGDVTKEMLYGSYSYAIGYGPVTRLTILLNAALWIMALLSLFMTRLDRKLPLISVAGQSTLSVYLFHGFVVRFLGRNGLFADSFLLAAIVTVLLVVLFGNPWVGSVLNGPARIQRG